MTDKDALPLCVWLDDDEPEGVGVELGVGCSEVDWVTLEVGICEAVAPGDRACDGVPLKLGDVLGVAD